MAEAFEIADLVKVAVEDERTGVVFYGRLAEKSGKLRELFGQLKDAEEHHLKRFQDMLDQLGEIRTREQYPGEYMAYLRVMTEGRAFPDGATAARMAQECKGDAEALALANRFERDTLILLNELTGLAPARHAAIVDDIIAEEQAHLVALAKAQRLLA